MTQAQLSWDVTSGNGTVDGGTGNWNLTDSFWTPDAGLSNVVWDPAQTAVFGTGTAGTATINTGTGISAAGLTFNVPTTGTGYIIAGAPSTDALTITGGGTVLQAGGVNTISTRLITAGPLNVTGGTLRLTNTVLGASANNLTGSTVTISSGGTLEASFGGVRPGAPGASGSEFAGHRGDQSQWRHPKFHGQ